MFLLHVLYSKEELDKPRLPDSRVLSLLHTTTCSSAFQLN